MSEALGGEGREGRENTEQTDKDGMNGNRSRNMRLDHFRLLPFFSFVPYSLFPG
jgi:hypothetical protein